MLGVGVPTPLPAPMPSPPEWFSWELPEGMPYCLVAFQCFPVPLHERVPIALSM